MRPILIAAFAFALACSKEPPPAPTPVSPSDRPAPAQAPPQQPRGPEHSVYSLADNRLLAHVERGGGLVALPGSAGFAKYMRFAKPNPNKLPWQTKQWRDDRAVGLNAGSFAPLQAPLTDEQARATAIHTRLHSPAPRRMTVMVNAKNAATLELAAGWQIVTATVAPGLLKAGENELQLVF